MNQLRERTRGDGIDNTILKITENVLKIPKIKPQTHITFKPVEPSCQLIPLKPVHVTHKRKNTKYLIRRPKEPKFVPYEPYKGAIEPIIRRITQAKSLPMKASKNNVAIQELVTQLAEFRVAELSKAEEEAVQNDEPFIPRKQWEQEKLGYENDIKNLRETNSHLENQIKFQTQVNSELKTLLVAAVGEDLESRVQHLTEDKLQLARALLNSANHLTSHQEKTEWLSGQCEVWRSKFLASSLMVEELARWKSALTTRHSELQEIIKKLIDERYRVQKKTLKTTCFLTTIKETLTNDEHLSQGLKNSNVLELSSFNYKLSQEIGELIDVNKEKCDEVYEKYMRLSDQTEVEKVALKVLQNPVVVSNKQDALCSALVGTALSLSGDQVYLKNPPHCCSHCKGEIEDI